MNHPATLENIARSRELGGGDEEIQAIRPIGVTGGRIQGAVEGGVFVFRGVPFAAPIAGADRWRAPRAVVAWHGVRPATRFGSVCPQPSARGGLVGMAMRAKRSSRFFLDATANLGAPMGDDCLNLNVWTPSLDPAAKLPVLVFIHGGSFVAGAGSSPFYDGKASALAGLVLVTINYRLGVMGFVGGDDLFAGGMGVANRGFLDQVRALQWVADNIALLGGDRDCVTVCGESAGAASALMLAASPATAGLARRFVSMSGAPVSYPHDECSRFAADWFASMGVGPNDTDGLAALTAERILNARPQPGQVLRRNRQRYGALGADALAWQVPAIGTDLFPKNPLAFIGDGGRPGVELLIGTCRDEARMWTIALPLPDALASRMMLSLFAALLRPKGRPHETLKAYRRLMPHASATELRERAVTDALFRRPTVAFADAASRVSPGHVFLYRFNWASPALGGVYGAMHAMDLPGLFQSYRDFAPIVGPEATARAAGDALHQAVVSFAKTGAPAVPGAEAWPALRKRWPGLHGDRQRMLVAP